MESFVYQKKMGVPFFRLEQWEKEFPTLTVGFSARDPKEDWNAYNYALHVGGDPTRIMQNRKNLTRSIGFPFQSWTCGEQVHGVHIEIVDFSQRGKGSDSRETAFQETDGLLTGESDLLLASYYADCVPLYFYSPDLDWVGIAHAGWRGTVGQIGPRMVDKLVEQGAERQNIRIAIGPSIGACCYEVDEHVITPLQDALGKAELTPNIATYNGQGRWQCDLKQANAAILQKNGISIKQIVMTSWCTSCGIDYFYSHRRDQGKTGRMVAWIGKKERR